MAHIPRLLDLPEKLRGKVHLFDVYLLDGNPLSLKLTDGGVHLRRKRGEAGNGSPARVNSKLLQRDVLHIQALQSALGPKHASHLDKDVIRPHPPGHIVQLLAEFHLPENKKKFIS